MYGTEKKEEDKEFNGIDPSGGFPLFLNLKKEEGEVEEDKEEEAKECEGEDGIEGGKEVMKLDRRVDDLNSP